MNEPGGFLVAVGQPHPLLKPGTPPGTVYCYSCGYHHVVISYPGVRPDERDAFEWDKRALALYTDFPTGQAVTLLHRIGGLPWMMAQYHSRLQPDSEWVAPEIPEKGLAPIITAYLVDARDRVVQAMRQFAPGHDFSRALLHALRVQRQMPWNPAAYRMEVARLDDPAKPSQVCIQRVLNRAQVRWEGRA
jgi:hypothetical protein